MQFDLTTFALEVFNFLVLVWLLKRFFYQPVLAVIEARRAAGAAILDRAEAAQRAADAMKAECEARLKQADLERAAAAAALEREIAAQRVRRLAALESELKCLMRTVVSEATVTTGDEGMCAVEEMMTRAKRISAQRKFLRGLYDVYVNAALASGLPDRLLPSPVSGSGSGGQEGENGGGMPTAP